MEVNHIMDFIVDMLYLCRQISPPLCGGEVGLRIEIEMLPGEWRE